MLTNEHVRDIQHGVGVTDIYWRTQNERDLMYLSTEVLRLRAERVAWESTGDAALRDLAEIQRERDALRAALDRVVGVLMDVQQWFESNPGLSNDMPQLLTGILADLPTDEIAERLVSEWLDQPEKETTDGE